MSDSPAVILYDANGNEVALENAQIPPVNNKAVPIAGTDGTNARHILTDNTGKLLISPLASLSVVPGVPSNINNKLSISDLKLLRQSSFPYKINNLEYSTNIISSGTVTYQADASAQILASTGATSSAELRTNSFYKLPINSSIVLRQTILHNDVGQVDQERRWRNI